MPTLTPADVFVPVLHRRLIPRTQQGYDYACSTEANRGTSACEVSQHRFLPGQEQKNAFLPETSEASLCKPSNLRACTDNGQASMPPPSTAYYDNAERNPRKRGWRAQGLLAGEWRDRFGRHRRACHSDKPQHAAVSSSVVADLSMASIPCSSSCAGTEVSFEGLIEELRKRLPNSSSSLLEMVAAQHSIAESALEEANSMAEGAGNPDFKKGRGESDADVDIEPAGGGRRGHDAININNANATCNLVDEMIGENCPSPLRRGLTRECTTSTQQQRGLPRGCLQLRPMVEPFRASPSRQALSAGFGSRLRQVVGSNPSSLQLGPLPHGGSSSSKYDIPAATATAVREENVSPSAAMVAAAKAQERALPLLQVCAVKLVEPPGG